jgi:outer membrane lipoprotein-sorting protein
VSSVLVASPHAARLLPLDDPEIDAGALLALAQGSTTVSFSGYVESQGNLDLPVTESFSDLTDLLVDRTRMRVWWSSPQQWRVDTLHPTGETDLVHNASGTVVWDYERNRAVASSEPRVRLPRASDLLPNELARQLLATATPAEVTRLPAQRVAGLDAPGLRLDPAAEQSSIQHADIWVDPASGLPVRVAVHGKGDVDPSLTTQFLDLDLTAPSAERSGFSTPPRRTRPTRKPSTSPTRPTATRPPVPRNGWPGWRGAPAPAARSAPTAEVPPRCWPCRCRRRSPRRCVSSSPSMPAPARTRRARHSASDHSTCC